LKLEIQVPATAILVFIMVYLPENHDVEAEAEARVQLSKDITFTSAHMAIVYNPDNNGAQVAFTGSLWDNPRTYISFALVSDGGFEPLNYGQGVSEDVRLLLEKPEFLERILTVARFEDGHGSREDRISYVHANIEEYEQ